MGGRQRNRAQNGHTWGETVTLQIFYMFTIYTLLLIELQIIGNRISFAYTFLYSEFVFYSKRSIWSFIAKVSFAHSMFYSLIVIRRQIDNERARESARSERQMAKWKKAKQWTNADMKQCSAGWLLSLTWVLFFSLVIYESRHSFGI